MAAIDQQIQDLESRLKEAWRILDLDASQKQVRELEAQMSEEGFWDDQERAKSVSQQAADLKAEWETWDSIKQEIEDAASMLALAEEEGNADVVKDVVKTVEELDQRLRVLERNTLFSGPYDTNNAILSIHAGAGGADAMDWAGMLARMFTRFAEQKGWTTSMLDSSAGEEAGYKSITFRIEGRRAYGHLRSEAGVHRLVRISPFDAEKMRHTSFALVEVVPELDALSEKELEIDPNDLRIDTFMSSGKGGQSVNTTYSAVRITHLPTNIVVTCQNERSQSQNKETAMKVLKARLFQKMQEERAEKIDQLKGGHTSPEWGNQIRSYVLHPYKMAKDHRTNLEVQDVDGVLNGDIEPFVESFLRQEVERENVERAS